MFSNIGILDRGLRLLFGAVLILIVVLDPHLKIGLLGIILILSSVLSICPVYLLLDISTRSKSCGRMGPLPRRYGAMAGSGAKPAPGQMHDLRTGHG